MGTVRYEESVFLNVPFDKRFKPLFDAIVFAVYDCGFVPRSALEEYDATQVPIDKIYQLISVSKYGIHDLSRTGLDRTHRLPRFNMPLELGVFLGSKKFGKGKHLAKRGLVLDSDRYRYQKFCSDISGLDISAHHNTVSGAIRSVRNWVRSSPDTRGVLLPGTNLIYHRYQAFRRQLPRLCLQVGLDKSDLHFNDYTTLVSGWLRMKPR